MSTFCFVPHIEALYNYEIKLRGHGHKSYATGVASIF